jgi:hypothetical protein
LHVQRLAGPRPGPGIAQPGRLPIAELELASPGEAVDAEGGANGIQIERLRHQLRHPLDEFVGELDRLPRRSRFGIGHHPFDGRRVRPAVLNEVGRQERDGPPAPPQQPLCPPPRVLEPGPVKGPPGLPEAVTRPRPSLRGRFRPAAPSGPPVSRLTATGPT